MWAVGLICVAAAQVLVGVLMIQQTRWTGNAREYVMGLVDDLKAIKDQLGRAHEEIVLRVTSLDEKLAAAGVVDPEVVATLEAIKATAQALDDIVPDEVAELPTSEEVNEQQ